jgi:two-component system cell cycle response regulator
MGDNNEHEPGKEFAGLSASEAGPRSWEKRRQCQIEAEAELTGPVVNHAASGQDHSHTARAHRAGAKLVAAFIDVDGLKEVNDTDGHMAGDSVLRLVGETLRANVRVYDVLVRHGGDEILCAMPNLTAVAAKLHFEKIATVRTSVDTRHSITFGLAEAESGDSLEDLFMHAHDALREARRAREN